MPSCHPLGASVIAVAVDVDVVVFVVVVIVVVIGVIESFVSAH